MKTKSPPKNIRLGLKIKLKGNTPTIYVAELVTSGKQIKNEYFFLDDYNILQSKQTYVDESLLENFKLKYLESSEETRLERKKPPSYFA